MLRLEPGQVNIITGRSRTGKSQLIPIVEYILGSSIIKVARGPIRNTVQWYALHLSFGDTQLVVARKCPEPGFKSSTAAFLLEGTDLTVPEQSPVQNCSMTEVEAAINTRLGIAANLNVPAANRRSPPLSANYRHALLYSFQNQTEIADPNVLFHRQAEGNPMTLALRDTLPYFLGVIQEDALPLQQNLRRLQHRLVVARRALREAEEVRGHPTEGLRKAFNLLGEARELGLVPPTFNESLDDLDRLTELLRRIAAWTPEVPAEVPTSRLSPLMEERDRLRLQRDRLKENIETLKTYALEAEGFVPAAREQALRLESIGFYEAADHNPLACPTCGQAMENPTPTAQRFGERLAQLNQQLEVATRSQPQLRRQIDALEQQQADMDERSRSLYGEIQALYAQQEALTRLKDENYARARLTGRISLWLESVTAADDLDALAQDVRSLEYQVNQLEAQLSVESAQARLNRVMVALGTQMTRWAQELALEPMDEGAFVELDPVRMALTISTLRERMPLTEIGSGANWLGYHLVVHFALHAHFVRQQRPTPRFLFLDQPTQVYFPESSAAQDQVKESGQVQDDWRAVQQLFHFILDTVSGLSPHFQVIISDHANLREDDRFQGAIREVWRDGHALIPQAWIEEWQESHPVPAPESEGDDEGENSAPELA